MPVSFVEPRSASVAGTSATSPSARAGRSLDADGPRRTRSAEPGLAAGGAAAGGRRRRRSQDEPRRSRSVERSVGSGGGERRARSVEGRGAAEPRRTRSVPQPAAGGGSSSSSHDREARRTRSTEGGGGGGGGRRRPADDGSPQRRGGGGRRRRGSREGSALADGSEAEVRSLSMMRPPAVSVRPASPRVLSAALLESPPPSARGGATVAAASAAHFDMAKLTGEADEEVRLDSTGAISPKAQTSGEILRLAAERARQRKADAAAAAAAGEDEDEEERMEGRGRSGRRPSYEAAEEEMDFAVGADGKFKLVPKKEEPAKVRRKSSLMERWRGRSSRANEMVSIAIRAAQARGEKHVPTHPVRFYLWRMQKAFWFKGIILVSILITASFLATEYPLDEEKKEVYRRADLAFSILFTLEMAIKVGALGKHYLFNSSGKFNGWNSLDAFVVITGWLALALEALMGGELKAVKLLRLIRVLRPLRTISIIPALRDIINAVIFSVRDLGNTMLLIAFFLAMFGIFLVSLLSGYLRYRCRDDYSGEWLYPSGRVCAPPYLSGQQCPINSTCVDSGYGPYANLSGMAPFYIVDSGGVPSPIHANPPYIPPFDSMLWSLLAVFEIWSGVGWTFIMYTVTDSQGQWIEFLFITMYILGAWFLINLMIAVLGSSFEREQTRRRVERAKKRAQLKVLKQIAAKEKSRQARVKGRFALPRTILRMQFWSKQPEAEEGPSEDGSPEPAAGSAWARGVTAAFGAEPDEAEAEAAVAADRLIAAKTKAARALTHAALTPHPSPRPSPRSEPDAPPSAPPGTLESLSFRLLIVSIILGNTIATAVDTPFTSAQFGAGRQESLLTGLSRFFGVVFFIEAALKIFVMGLRSYVSSKLNCFDGAIVLLFFLELMLVAAGINAVKTFAAIKVFRLLRVFILARSMPAFASLLSKMATSIAAIYSMLIVLAILLFLVATLCLHLFADVYTKPNGGKCDSSDLSALHSEPCALKPRSHFDDILMSYAASFQIMTTDGWTNIMYDTYVAKGPLSLVVFPVVVILGNFVTLNLFLAILLSTFSQASKREAKEQAEREARKQEEAARANRDAALAGIFNPTTPSPGGRRTSSVQGGWGRRSVRSRSPPASLRSSTRRASSVSPPAARRGACGGGGGATRSPSVAARSASAAAASPGSGGGTCFPGMSPGGVSVASTGSPGSTASSANRWNAARAKAFGVKQQDDDPLTLDALEDIGRGDALKMFDDAKDKFVAKARAWMWDNLLPERFTHSAYAARLLERRKAAAEERLRAKGQAAVAADKAGKKLRRSIIRQKGSRYGLLNAWEVAHFKGKFHEADLDGDGYLTLEEVYLLLFALEEEPKSLSTWEVLDANAERDDLVSMHDFLVFLSIKRNDDAKINEEAKDGVPAAKQEARNRLIDDSDGLNNRRKQLADRAHRKRTALSLLTRRLARLRNFLKRVYTDRLPPLGEYAMEGLGEERARSMQRFVYSNGFWYVEIIVIICSALLITTEIDIMVRQMRLEAGSASASRDSLIPAGVISAFDAAFVLLISCSILIKMATQGVRDYLGRPWEQLDVFCLLCTYAQLLFRLPEWKRTLMSFGAVRVFMLAGRVRELRKLAESILRALPNVMVTMASVLIIWLMFAILGVTLFGGTSSQCAAIGQTAGYPGCGVDLGSKGANGEKLTGYADCRYAKAPLPPPMGVIPGTTNSTGCGCEWINGVHHCKPINISGVEVMWVEAFPSFDSTANALLALFQVASLDGWASVMHFAIDRTAVDVQPWREVPGGTPTPVLFYLTFVIFGTLFATNVFVGVVIDEFQKIKRRYDGSATLTEEQIKWVNTQRLMFRLRPERHVTYEPTDEFPRRRFCFRLVHDEKEHGRPANAPLNATYHGASFERSVFIAVCLNVCTLCLWSSPIHPAVKATYDAFDYLFVALFAAEAGLKIGAFTFKEYIKTRWNQFDFFLVVFSIFALAAAKFASLAAGIDVADRPEYRWLICARALRIVRLAQVSPALLKVMRTMLYASPSIANITALIAIFTFAYAQFGMAFLGTLLYDDEGAGFSRHANFQTVFRAFSSLTRMATADSWSALLMDAVHNPHVPSVTPPPKGLVYFFFIFYMAFMGWILVSIFVAIILDYFNESNAEEGIRVKYEDIEAFQIKWLEFDTRSTSYIRTIDLGLLLYSCKPPLVGVQAHARDGLFFEGSKLQRPTLSQLEQVLVELDIPEHDGSVHFLEVLLALLQRLTGVIHEEQIIQQLLTLHPTYVDSVKRMPAITGSTSDAYVKDEIMAHLHRGLKATGLLEVAEREPSPSNSMVNRRGSASAVAKSFTRRVTRGRVGGKEQTDEEIEIEEAKRLAAEERIRDIQRSQLSRCAATNATTRGVLDKFQRGSLDAGERRASSTGWGSALQAATAGGAAAAGPDRRSASTPWGSVVASADSRPGQRAPFGGSLRSSEQSEASAGRSPAGGGWARFKADDPLVA